MRTLTSQQRQFGATLLLFALCYFLPVEEPRVTSGLLEALALVRWYAREHVILCLLPAFMIAGAISTYVSQQTILRRLGPAAAKWAAYSTAAVGGSVLAVCSCTILPLFNGIYRMGAGLGPATTFLYAGPAINVLALILTTRILGPELGLARALGAVTFSVVIGSCMHLLHRREEAERGSQHLQLPEEEDTQPRHATLLLFVGLFGILVFANLGDQVGGPVYQALTAFRWQLVAAGFLLITTILVRYHRLSGVAATLAVIMVAIAVILFWPQVNLVFFLGFAAFLILLGTRDSTRNWLAESWSFARQILPLLLMGVAVAGFLLGRPGHAGLVPAGWIEAAVGGNSLKANFMAAFCGAFMYFATLTEIPILQGLLGSGMGKGPALALLLAGPAVSLPNMLVIHSVLGTRKTIEFVVLVIIMATISGYLYGQYL